MNNREFKFRIWNGEKWLDDAVVLSLEGKLCDMFLYRPNQFEKCVIQQFTGANDRNGKEIYEGDIINHYSRGILLVNFGRYLDGKGLAHSGFYLNSGDKNTGLDGSVEIIGNIFENTELLTK